VKLPSVVSTAYFSKSIPIQRAQYFSPPAQRRPGSGGENALIDLVRATAEVGDRAWQGYDKNDLDVILDLGQLRDLEEITLSCLENSGARAFLPASIEISVSGDKKEYRTVATQKEMFQILFSESRNTLPELTTKPFIRILPISRDFSIKVLAFTT
jgi:hypothetical protein